MTQPTGYCSDHQPLVAFGESFPGVFEFDADLAVHEVTVGAVKTLTQASGRLFAGEVRSAIPGDPPIRERLTRSEIELRYPPYKRFAIGTQATDPAQRQYVALGFMSKPTVKFGAAPNNAFWHEGWCLDSELVREATAEGRVLQGQYRVSEALAASLEDEWWNTTIEDLIEPDVGNPIKLVGSEPLCFNPEGRPNRFRRPIRVIYPGRYGEPDRWVNLYVFTDPDGPHAESWTYHQALQYLWFASMQAAAVRAGNLFDMDDLINLGIGGVSTYLLGPEDVDVAWPGWLPAMVRYCETFTPEGRTIIEALVLLNQLCGLRFREVVDNSDGEPVARLHFWVAGDSPTVELLEAEIDGSPFTAGGVLRDVETDVLQRNNVSNARVLKDYSEVLTHVQVVGDRERLVLRIELVPLWQPHEDWDNVGEEEFGALVDDAVGDAGDFSLAKESLFYKRHHQNGEYWADGENAIVGRLYGADFGAELDPDDYNRNDPPYDDYGPILWSALGAWGGTGAPGGQVRRRRQLMPLTAVDASGRSVGVVVEVSWDGGATWHRLGTNEYRTIPEYAAIHVKKENLLGFGRDVLERIEAEGGGNPVRNYYDAYIRRVFRLRVTALVDLDDRVLGERYDPWTTLGTWGPLGDSTASRTLLRKEFRRVDTSRFLDHDYVGDGEVDDQDAAADFAYGALHPRLGPTVSASPVIPWLDVDPERYPVGTPIGGIRRSPLSNDQDLSFTTWVGSDGLRPEVLGKVFKQSVEGASTELILERFTYAPSHG